MGKRIRVGVEYENYLIRMGWLGYANNQLEINATEPHSRTTPRLHYYWLPQSALHANAA